MKDAVELSRLLDDSVRETVKDAKPVAVLFSGGLDSSVIAHLAKRHSDIVLYTCGLEDSHDLRMARRASKLIDMPVQEIIVKENDVLEGVKGVERIMGTKDPAKVTIALPLYLTAKGVKEKVMLSGQGADELFGGYPTYLGHRLAGAETNLARDFEELICTDIMNNIKIASSFSKEIRFPYLNREVVNFALYLPVRQKVREEHRKIMLRA
ncbi:MAG: asparagine synthase C-terminal domain-containing protein, partial [Thermoplasmata archaeon]|nr:asparagine synthase C-terminal domain-containing protein [Thermoplasmata archaeon]